MCAGKLDACRAGCNLERRQRVFMPAVPGASVDAHMCTWSAPGHMYLVSARTYVLSQRQDMLPQTPCAPHCTQAMWKQLKMQVQHVAAWQPAAGAVAVTRHTSCLQLLHDLLAARLLGKVYLIITSGNATVSMPHKATSAPLVPA
jgi:hypothetical protein